MSNGWKWDIGLLETVVYILEFALCIKRKPVLENFLNLNFRYPYLCFIVMEAFFLSLSFSAD
jgi:hypothetical protein